jgi:hypothetical protein
MEKQINYYKSKSNYMVIMYILMFKILRFINSHIFYLLVSLALTLSITFLFGGPLLFVLIIHLIFWKIITSYKLFNKESMDEDNVEITYYIDKLSEYLKTKKGVK